MTKYHTTKDGIKIKIKDLETSHLLNIINLIEKMSKNGYTVIDGGGTCAEDMWFDSETYYGEEAKKLLNFYDYIKEYRFRKNSIEYAKEIELKNLLNSNQGY